MRFIIYQIFIISTFAYNLQGQMAVWETKDSGTVGSVKFKLKNLDKTENMQYEWDFSDNKHFYYPLKENGTYCAFAGSDSWHLMFDNNVRYLNLYIGVWRPGIYKFSESFRLLSSSSNVKKMDNYLIIEGSSGNYGGFGNAQIVFDSQICCLFVESSRMDKGPQILTFGLYDGHNCGGLITKKVTKKSLKQRIKCYQESKLFPRRQLEN